MPPLPKFSTLKPLSHILTFTLLHFLNLVPDLGGLGVTEIPTTVSALKTKGGSRRIRPLPTRKVN